MSLRDDGAAALEWLAEYLDGVRERPVLSRVEPGAWAHNFDYTAQLLHDSAADLGADVSKLRRP